MKKVLFLLLLMIIPACGMECLASIKLNLNQCVRQGDNVVMNFVIQNDGDKDVSFDLGSDSFNPSIVYDLQGCQYKATCLQQGNKSGTINLPSDITIKLNVVVYDVPQNVSEFAAVGVYFRSESRDGCLVWKRTESKAVLKITN